MKISREFLSQLKRDSLLTSIYLIVTFVSLTLFVWRAVSDISDRCMPPIKAATELVEKSRGAVKESQEELSKILERIEKLRKSLPFDEGPGDEATQPISQP